MHLPPARLAIPALFALAGCTAVPPSTLTPISVDGFRIRDDITSGAVHYPDLGGGGISLPADVRDNRSFAQRLLDETAVQPGFAIVPGLEKLPWNDLRNTPVEQRGALTGTIDSSLSQLRGAADIARQSQPRPGQEAAHAAAIAALDESLRELARQRENLELAPATGGWESAKDRVREAWEKSEAAYGSARATGY